MTHKNNLVWWTAAVLCVAALVLLTCCKDKPTESANRPPSQPVNNTLSGSPAHGSSGVSCKPTLSWTCSDPDGEALTYDVHFGKTATPPVVSTGQSGTSYATRTLGYDSTYYWRVVARDRNGATTSSDTWSFWTAAQSPHVVVNPTSLSFSAVQNGSLPGSKTFTITNSGGGTLNWSVSEKIGSTWLDETPKGPTNSNSQTITVSITSTALVPGTYRDTILVSSTNADNSPQKVAVSYTVTAAPVPPHIVLSPTSLSFSAVQNGSLPGNQTFTITNSGGGTLNWSVSASISWLTVSPTSGNSNSATITVSINTTNLSPNTYTGTITVSSGNADNNPQAVAVSYTVTIPQCEITVTSPTASSNWTKGTQQTIIWNSANAGSNVRISLYKDGSNQHTITTSTPNDSAYTWTVDDFGQGTGSGYLIKVSDASDLTCWGNSPNFTITTCEITVNRPNSTITWAVGQNGTVDWTPTSACGSTVKIELYKGTTNLCSYTSSTSNDGLQTFTVNDCGGGPGTNYRIKVTDNTTGEYDYSSYFTIEEPPCAITVTSPTATSNWTKGTQQTIRWTSSNSSGNVFIRIFKNGTNGHVIANSTPDDGSYVWTVDDYGLGTGSDYSIQVYDVNEFACRDDSPDFTITVNEQTVYLEIIATATGFYFNSNYWSGTIYLKFSDFGWRYDAPTWNDCGGSLILEGGYGVDETTCFYPSECATCTDYGLSISSSCTSVLMSVKADLEDPTWGSIYAKTDQSSSCEWSMSFSSSCVTRSATVSKSCLATSGRTEISVCHEDTWPLGDREAAIESVKFTFNGWKIPAAAPFQGEVMVIQQNDE